MEQKSIWAFDQLPQEIQDWLQSESVESIIAELNKKYQLQGYQLTAVSLLTTWLVIKTIIPKAFLPVLLNEFNLSVPVGTALAQDIKKRILLPVKHGLRRVANIDIDEISFEPPVQVQARVDRFVQGKIAAPSTPISPAPQRAQTHVSPLPSQIPPPKQNAPEARLTKITGLEPGDSTVNLKGARLSRPVPPPQFSSPARPLVQARTEKAQLSIDPATRPPRKDFPKTTPQTEEKSLEYSGPEARTEKLQAPFPAPLEEKEEFSRPLPKPAKEIPPQPPAQKTSETPFVDPQPSAPPFVPAKTQNIPSARVLETAQPFEEDEVDLPTNLPPKQP